MRPGYAALLKSALQAFELTCLRFVHLVQGVFDAAVDCFFLVVEAAAWRRRRTSMELSARLETSAGETSTLSQVVKAAWRRS